ncbi:MAG: hypothetical protein GWO24_16970 [Akkermansiaceae bacterium]|nr:hypothetical protein [Akkermansiaceae bacterium]
MPRPGPGDIQVDPTAFLPGGRPLTRIVPEGGFGTGGPNGAGIGCPSGYHPNKSSYFLRDGTFIARGTKCVKNRRRNPANPRALDRAIGRLNSAKRLQHKLGGFSTRKYTAAGHKKKGSCR